ncbi:MAG: protein TolR [Proteobacteria bacterium]|nr:protein TolR [Pseudomonadota bacterium]
MSMNLGPSSHRGHKLYRPMAEINVTPMVDVMLVLLIIFMVAAPMLTQGVQVALPKADAKPIQQDKPVEVALKADGRIFVGSTEVAKENLVDKLAAIQEGRDEASILLRADKDMPYGRVMEVMAILQAAGMVDVGMVTEPTE